MAPRRKTARGKAGSKARGKRAKRGRPPLKVTKKLRERVQEYRACGMSEEDIALALDISRPTLRKHFSLELRKGHAVKRAHAINLLWSTAKKGNVSAQRKLIDMTKVMEDPKTAGERAADPKGPPNLKVIARGKKEQAQDDAHTAHLGTEWEGVLDDVDPSTSSKN